MKNKPYLPWLAGWFILNLVQSYFTELWHDEAHYWMFSQNLDWGFWDHPPMTPLLISLGYGLIPNELGVRLFIVLANTLTLFFCYKVVQPRNVQLFFTMLFGIFFVHVGWMAAPDISLLFFTGAFFYVYQRYQAEDTWRDAGLLALIVAGMAYSKYHGAIVLLFALLSYWPIMKRKSFWLIPVVAAVLFLPHLYWQYAMDFPTFRYHLIDRGQEAYRWEFIPEFIGGQLAMFGPLLSIPLFIAAVRFQKTTKFGQTMKWCFYGIMLFFFSRSFSEQTEANWTATAFIPVVYLAYHFIENKANWRKWIYRLAIPSIVLFAIFRLYLMWDFLPQGLNPRNEFHGWDQWAEQISEKAGDHPVMFYNTYRGPSKYQFYAQKPAHAMSVYFHAGNQYELMHDKMAQLQGDTVMKIGSATYYKDESSHFKAGTDSLGHEFISNFRSYNNIKIKLLEKSPVTLPPDTTIEVPIRLYNPTKYDYDFFGNAAHPAVLEFQFYEVERVVRREVTLDSLPIKILKAGEHIDLTAKIITPKEVGDFRWRFTIATKGLHNGRNMNAMDITVDGGMGND